MKKKISLVLAILLLVTVSFAACGNDNPFLGKWKLTKAQMDEQVLEGDQLEENIGKIVIEIKKDGVYTGYSGDAEPQDGKWEEDKDGSIVLDGSMNATIQDDMLVVDMEFMQMYFEKQ